MKMTLARYLERKAAPTSAERQRIPCVACRKPPVSCYCATLRPFDSSPRIVILMHPLEAKHPIGTGRMAHLCLSNSKLWVSADFERHDELGELLADPKLYPVLLYPGPKSRNLTTMTERERFELAPPGRELAVIVLDATWHNARKMLLYSPRLQKLPRVSFTTQQTSRFIVRKQPQAHCLSSLEAVHEILRLLEAKTSKPAPIRHLLDVFDAMVARQLEHRSRPGPSRHAGGYAARKARRARALEEKQRSEAPPVGAEILPNLHSKNAQAPD